MVDFALNLYLDLTMNDNTTLAIVVTLSCLLVLILSATVIVWWKLRRKKNYGERLDSITSANSSNLGKNLTIFFIGKSVLSKSKDI